MFTKEPQSLTQAAIDAVNVKIVDLINDINALNDTGTALTKDERKEGVTVSVRRKAFQDYYFANKDAPANAAFKPSQTLLPEADAVKHLFVQTQVAPLIGQLFTAIEILQDMQLNSEHFTFNYASDGRNAATEAKKNGLPGADAWSDALNELYPKKGNRGVVNAPNP